MKRNHSVNRHQIQTFMKIASTLLLTLAASVASAFGAGFTWDSSGNSQLNGTYYFRQVIYQADSNGNASGYYAYYGNIVFTPGNGTYSITTGTFLSDTSQGFSANTSATATGTYSVSASGYGFLSSPLITAAAGQPAINVIFLVSKGILIGSETESGYNDLFIAAPVSTSLSNSSFSGAYTIAGFFPGVSPASAADATYQLNPNGAGTLGTVSISGFNGGGTTLLQSSSGVKYSFSNGANVITFPTNNSANFYSGQEYMYLSPDANFVFGGSPQGFDMFVGVRNATSGTTTALSGLYYQAGIDDNELNGLDSYYGAFNAFSGSVVSHQRLLLSGNSSGIGDTFYDSYPTSIANGTYSDKSPYPFTYTVGQGGIRLGYGTGGYLGFQVALPYTSPTATGSVYLDPTGIVNTASSAPYTAGISPGDFITIYNGVNLASSTYFAPAGAFPATLGNVTVLIDGLPAPIYYVSPTQVSVLVPYEVSTFPIASIQVKNNGVLSNSVTTYVDLTTPGVFTANPVGGIGDAAMLDFPSSGGYHVVSESNPAAPGDTVAVFLTGLGAPFPSITDGALGTATGDILVQTINVDVGGIDVGTPAYAGLAPGLAGLYQINFTVPILCTTTGQTSCVTAGDNSLGITGPDSYSNESIIPVGTAPITITGEVTPGKARIAARQKALPRLLRSPGATIHTPLPTAPSAPL